MPGNQEGGNHMARKKTLEELQAGLKVKNCSTLFLIIGHGIYDALITVWASTLL